MITDTTEKDKTLQPSKKICSYRKHQLFTKVLKIYIFYKSTCFRWPRILSNKCLPRLPHDVHGDPRHITPKAGQVQGGRAQTRITEEFAREFTAVSHQIKFIVKASITTHNTAVHVYSRHVL